jgi:hypothetical protein
VRTEPARAGSSLAALLAGGLLALALAPGLLAGVAAGEVLRRRRLRWTWMLAAGIGVAPVIVLLGPAAWSRLIAVPDKGVMLGAVVAAGWLPWLAATPVAGSWWMLRAARRDRLHGGHAAQRLVLARGPVELAGTALARRQAQRAGVLDGDRILLGVDARDRPARVLRPHAHVTIVGASNSGKTTTAKLLLTAHVQAGGAVVVLDGKGGHDLPHHLRRLAAKHRRPVALWSPVRYGTPVLDGLRVAWDACSDGTPTEVKDRIASAEPQTEPYYAAIASRGLQAATTALHHAGEPLALDRIAGLLDQPPALAALLRAADHEPLAKEAAWLAGLTDGERSGLRGIATRLATMTGADAGRWLLPHPRGRTLLLSNAIRKGWLVVFSLPAGTFPELVPHVGRYVLSTLNAIAGQLESSGERADAMVLVDELSVFDGDQLASGLERGRSAGLRYILATQSLSNFETSGGPKLAAAALDNAELMIVHRQAVPDAADVLAKLAGTEEAWEHTHQVDDHLSVMGLDESGKRARRLTDRFRAHPNTIRQLRQGEVIVIETRPRHRVRRVRIDPRLAQHLVAPTRPQL